MIHKTYVINLARRTDKRGHMEREFHNLSKQGISLNHVFFDAIDGRNKEVTSKYKFHIPNWADPTTGKALTEGEVGCALSHYLIWEDIVKTYEDGGMTGEYNVLILEDDVVFCEDFMNKFRLYSNELVGKEPYELLYLHRKALNIGAETKLTEHLMSNIRKSYWACAYILTYKGAKKIMNAKYLENMTPVDEFLPIMYGCNVNGFEKLYKINKLVTYAANPSLLKLTGNAFHESETYHTGSFSANSDSNSDNNSNSNSENQNILVNHPSLIVYVRNKTISHLDSFERFKSYCNIYGNPYITVQTAEEKYLINNYEEYTQDPQDVKQYKDKQNKVLKEIAEQVKSLVSKDTLITILNNPNAIPMAPPSEIQNKFNSLAENDKSKIVATAERMAFCCYVSAIDAITNESDYVIDSKFEIFRPVVRSTTVSFKHTVSRLVEGDSIYPCIVIGEALTTNGVENYTGNGWNEYYGFRVLPTVQENKQQKVFLSIHLGETTDVLGILKRLDYPKELLTTHINYINKQEHTDFTAINRDRVTNIGAVSFHSYMSEESLLEEGFNKFLKSDCDYYFYIGPTAILNNPSVLKELLALNKNIVCPFIKKQEGVWSNFWGDIDQYGYYRRSPDYFDIVEGRKRGCWNVPYITGVYLIKREILEAHPQILNKKSIDIDMRPCAYFRDNNVFMYVSNSSNNGHIY